MSGNDETTRDEEDKSYKAAEAAKDKEEVRFVR
jgi:hypothetical protein